MSKIAINSTSIPLYTIFFEFRALSPLSYAVYQYVYIQKNNIHHFYLYEMMNIVMFIAFFKPSVLLKHTINLYLRYFPRLISNNP